MAAVTVAPGDRVTYDPSREPVTDTGDFDPRDGVWIVQHVYAVVEGRMCALKRPDGSDRCNALVAHLRRESAREAT